MRKGLAVITAMAILLMNLFSTTSSATMGGGAGSGSGSVFLSPSDIMIDEGKSFTVDVVVQNIPDVYSGQFHLKYDPKKLRVIELIDGDLINGDNAKTIISESNDKTGDIYYARTYLGEAQTKSSGILATIRFEGIEAGQTSLDFLPFQGQSAVKLMNREGMINPDYQINGAQIQIKVVPILKNIRIEGPEEVGLNGQIQLSVKAEYSDREEPVNPSDVSWSSSDETVLRVSNGIVQGLKAGNATVTAIYQGKSAQHVVSVVPVLPAELAENSAKEGKYYYKSDLSEVFPLTVSFNYEEGSQLYWKLNETPDYVSYKGPITLNVSDVKDSSITVHTVVKKLGSEVAKDFVFNFEKVESPTISVSKEKELYDIPFQVTLDAPQGGTIFYQVIHIPKNSTNPEVSEWKEAKPGTTVHLGEEKAFRGQIQVKAYQVLNGINGSIQSLIKTTSYEVDTYNWFRFGRIKDFIARLGNLNAGQVRTLLSIIEERVADLRWISDEGEKKRLNEKLIDPAKGYNSASEAIHGMIAALENGMDVNHDGTLSDSEIQSFIDAAAKEDLLKLFQLVNDVRNSIPTTLKEKIQERINPDQAIDIILDLTDPQKVDLDSLSLNDALKEQIKAVLISNGITEQDFESLRNHGLTWNNLLTLAASLTPEEKEQIRQILEKMMGVTKDTVPPVITIDGNLDGAVIETEELTINGTLNEPGTVTASVADSTDQDTVSVPGGRFTLTLKLKVTGANTITITAVDKAGNRSELVLHVTYKPKSSNISPGGGGGGGGIIISPLPGEAKGKINAKQTNTIEIKDIVNLVVPAGAMNDGVEVSIRVLKEQDVPSAKDQNLEQVGQAVEITTTGNTRFAKDVEITFSLRPEDLNKGKLAVYYYNETRKKWMYIGGKVDAEKNTITVKVNHFTKFAVFSLKDYISFTDFTAKHWAYEYVDRLVGLKIISGRGNGIFDPEASVTRAEFARMLALALDLPKADEAELKLFTDVNDIPAWAKESVAAAVKAGIIKGRAKGDAVYFDPNAVITRAEMAVMIARAIGEKSVELNFVDKNKIPTWAIKGVESVVASGIMSGMPGNQFEPQGETTRAQAATVIAKLLHYLGL